jgi:hypothetical protein
MPTQPKDVIEANQNTKKKPTRAMAANPGSHPANGPETLSKEDSPLAKVPDSGPPKIPALEELDFADPSLLAGLARAFGTRDLDSICRLMVQVISTVPESEQGEPQNSNSFLATLHDIAPRDALEGLLAVQMTGVHEVAMRFLARGAGSQTRGEIDADINLAVKLMRTFTAQMEALNRHRGKITQPMMVGNVNVADGGQAIVGPVNHSGPGKVSEEDEKEKAG